MFFCAPKVSANCCSSVASLLIAKRRNVKVSRTMEQIQLAELSKLTEARTFTPTTWQRETLKKRGSLRATLKRAVDKDRMGKH